MFCFHICFSISQLSAIWVCCILQFTEASLKLDQIKFLCHHLQACYPPAPLKSRQLTQVIHISECDKNQPTHQTLLLYSNYRTKRIILIQESVSPKIRKDCLKSKQAKHPQSGPYHHLAIENVRS